MEDNYYFGVQPRTEAEQSVIGAILIDPDRVMPECEEILSEDDFLINEYRTIFKTCSGYFVDGKPIDFVTLVAQLGDEYKIILAEAIQVMPSIGNWKSYAEIVKKTAIRHRALESCQELAQGILSGVDLSDCQADSIKLCESLNTTTKDTTTTPAQGLSRFIAFNQNPRTYYRTGFSNLDDYTYMDKGDYIVIGGRPSTGKTAFTLQVLLYMAQHYRVVYFSLETSESKIFDRLIANYFDIPLWKIKNGNLTDWGSIPRRTDDFSKLNFAVVEAAGWTVQQIQAKAVQLKAEIIFIDYMGLIKSDGKGRYEKMTNISVDLHTMAQSRKITVIALSQLNREGKAEPDMTHLRESGQIEQDADIIILLHNMGKENQFDRKLIISKNKEGRTGTLSFSFDGVFQKFAEIEMRYEE